MILPLPQHSLFPFRSGLAIVLLLLFVFSSAAVAQTTSKPINFSADDVISNDETGIMIATGNVTLTQGESELTADRVEYNRLTGTALAIGNVRFRDKFGHFHYSEELELDKGFSHALAEPIISNMTDGSWIKGTTGDINAEAPSVYDNSFFTPCDCDYLEGEGPVWDIQADKTRHDPATKTVYHKHVTMRMAGVPFAYFPYLDHPDWTVRRRSGLMEPRYGYSSDLGSIYAQSYYWVTGDTTDLEITPYVFSNTGNALDLYFRKRWDEASLNAGFVLGNLNSNKKTRERVGAIDAIFETTLADSWKTVIDLNRTSQDTFLSRYKFRSTRELKTGFKSERVSGDRYNLVELYDYQDTRAGKTKEYEPSVLPSVIHERRLETPRKTMDTRLKMRLLQLNNDDHTDMARWSSEVTTYEPLELDYGNLTMESRSAAIIHDIQTAEGGSGYTGTLGQAVLAGGLGWSMPLAIASENRFAVIEPKLKYVHSFSSNRTNKIPRRDTADFNLDESNLFLLHRLQGDDYTVPGGRLDGGIAIDMDDPLLGAVEGFVGTSMRTSGEVTAGQVSSSGANKISDLIASLSITPENYYSIGVSARFDPHDFTVNASQTKATLNLGKTAITATHSQLGKSYFNNSNEQEELRFDVTQPIFGDWQAKITQIYDMSNDRRRLTKSLVGITYTGGLQDCLSIALEYGRDGKSDRDIKPVDAIYLSMTFKYLGTISTNELRRITRSESEN